jgi:hypothetical protein
MCGVPEAALLFEKAKQRYGSSAIWSKYLAARSKHALPAINYVDNAEQCPRCRLQLPKNEVSQLKRGETVLCENGQILMMKSRDRPFLRGEGGGLGDHRPVVAGSGRYPSPAD